MPKRTKVGKHTRAQLRHFKTAEAIVLRFAGWVYLRLTSLYVKIIKLSQFEATRSNCSPSILRVSDTDIFPQWVAIQ